MSEQERTSATLKACAGAMDLIGKQREETLTQIAQSLSVMLGSAVALVDGMGNVVGYQIKTGALHRVLGHMAGLDHPVTVPLCRTRIVLNHESSPWPLEGTSGVPAPVHPDLIRMSASAQAEGWTSVVVDAKQLADALAAISPPCVKASLHQTVPQEGADGAREVQP